MNIIVKGAREHNLKNISIELPRGKFIVFTGLSGSGKSSLAIDTIYAEGQRRYVESLSSYARQFLGQLQKPDVDHIEGLSPAICIDQKTTSKNPRSTVGTVTEIYDYLRLLYARVGTPHCPNCGREISHQTPDEIIDKVQELSTGTRFHVLAPVVKGRKGEYKELFERLRKDGFARVVVDGDIYNLDEEIRLERDVRHEIEVLVDRLEIKEGIRRRLADSVETALRVGEGVLIIEVLERVADAAIAQGSKTSLAARARNSRTTYSTLFSCPFCEINLGEIAPRNFSFNSPYGACPVCLGLGSKYEADEALIVDERISLEEGAIIPFHDTRVDFYPRMIEAVADHYGVPMDVPWQELTDKQRSVILHGTNGEKVHIRYKSIMGDHRAYDLDFDGVLANIDRRYGEADSEAMREKLGRYMRERTCSACNGTRLRKESLSVTVGGLNIFELCEHSVVKIIELIKQLQLSEKQQFIARRVLKEITERLRFLEDVGLGYLTLGRSAATLAGGEAQRIRLATQIGSGLAGVLYVLDEPSIGLHQRDNARLIKTLKQLQALGNTLLVVEHDEDTMRAADHIVDIGPGAGKHGGRVDFQGTFDELLASNTMTGKFVSGRRSIPIEMPRREGNGASLILRGARANNLKNVDVRFPLGTFICVTGVSGSGKSTLVIDTLWKAIASEFFRMKWDVGDHDSLEGLENIDKVVEIDQSPIGRTPRSNPVTYIGVFDEIRKVFAMTAEASVRGYKPGRFSFNVKGGRCEACRGDGTLKIEMHFLPDVYVECDVCKGKRYNQETLEVHFKGKNISEVLEMSTEEALSFFENIPRIKRKLQTIFDVGLGYIQLGQPAPTLSGGEAQRVKLASELSKVATGRTLYILDEPTTGLHFEDVRRLLEVLHRLVSSGNTVIVIEHNLEVIKTADHLIDLGPEGGDAGGELVVSGTPEEVARSKRSYTGKYLKPYLERHASLSETGTRPVVGPSEDGGKASGERLPKKKPSLERS